MQKRKIAVIQISEAGNEIASILKRGLGATVIERSMVNGQWSKYDAFVFI